MRKLRFIALAVTIQVSFLAIASAPVAVRVEVEPVGPVDGGIAVELTVQVSPEDRSRIGTNAMVRIELDGEAPPGQSPLWAVRMESNGTGVVETVWPPGEHALRVVISNPSGNDMGLWVGTVRIPGAGSSEAEAKPVSPPPVSEPEPSVPEAAAEPTDPEALVPEDGVEAGAAEATTPAAESTEEAPLEPAAAVAATAVDSLDQPETAASDPEPNPETPDPEAPQPAEADSVAELPAEAEDEEPSAGEVGAGAAVAAGVAVAETSPVVADEPEPGIEASAEADVQSETAVESPEPEVPDSEEVVVEPLRSGGEDPVVQPEVSPEPDAESVFEPPAPAPAEVAALLDSWSDAAPGSSELTIVAFQGREPAAGLEPSDIRLRVGGVETAVEAVGDATRAPLQLGVAVHVATEASEGWSRSGGRLYPLVRRASGGRGHVFFATGGQVGDWDRAPGDSQGPPGGTAPGELTSLITESLAKYQGRLGRKFLILVTDGRFTVEKAAWRAATTEAGNAGVPILIIALWDEKFSHKARKNLKAVADASGGGLFLVQGSDQLDRASERFGPMIDAGVALRFTPPSSVTLPARVAVETSSRDLDLSAPQGVR